MKRVDIAPPEPSQDPFAHDEWHLIDINGKQRGPIDNVDLRLAWEDGVASNEAYVWREGMGDWKKICDVDGLERYLSKGYAGRD